MGPIMQRLQIYLKTNTPFFYLYAFTEAVETALQAMANARQATTFDEQKRIAIGAVFLDAAALRVSVADRSFLPMNDKGSALEGASEEIFVPDEPLSVESSKLGSSISDLAGKMHGYFT